MTVLGITSAASPYQSGLTSRAAQARQSFQDLGAALSSGDLTAAQQAFDTMQQKLPGAGRASQNSDPARQTIQNLGSALESGNVTEAQQAYAKLQQNMGQIRGRGHHDHHNHKGGAARSEDGGSGGNTATAAPGTYTSEGLATTAPEGGTSFTASASVSVTASIEIDIKA